jgi:GH15 family glucan-1,4-alpha-glucosidase
VALVGRDGSVDWLCLPDVDSESVFGRLLDADRGGHFAITPVGEFAADRRYQPGSNVLETTFHTSSGSARLTDALTVGDGRLAPQRELVRRIECLAGTVKLRCELDARFGFGARRARLEARHGVVAARDGADHLALGAWGVGDARSGRADFLLESGDRALVALAFARGEPAVLPRRDDCERRLAHTEAWWPTWAERLSYDGRWREHVERSALVLRLLVFAPSGAVVAAPTTSLPERIGGGRNWDYRYAWVRDASYTLAALTRVGCESEGQAFFGWLMHALRLSLPRVGVLYRVDGRAPGAEQELRHLSGYRGSAPVRTGNGAAGQLQLDTFGILLDAVWIFVDAGGSLSRRTGKDVAGIADEVCRIWRRADSGIWEVRDAPRDYVHSKGMCWVALERACRLAERGALPDRREHWGTVAREIRAWIDEHGWDDAAGSYVRAPDLREPDAALLGLCLTGFAVDAPDRLEGTIDWVRRKLADGPFVYRYRGGDGLTRGEGAFLATSFWLVEALANARRLDEAVERMEALCASVNDVGLLAEEIDPGSGELLGNFPQALSHLALVNAALALERAWREEGQSP